MPSAAPRADAQAVSPADYRLAILNILEDSAVERDLLNQAQRALVNILDDFAEEKANLEATQRAIINILSDFEDEKAKVEAINSTLQTKTSELSRSNDELAMFAYIASHDLQEPLRMVTSYTQLLARRYQGQLDEKADSFINYIVDGTRRMQLLIQDLLVYSRVGGDAATRTITDCEDVMATVIRNLAELIAKTEAHITHDRLPEVRANTSEASQVLQNLIGNAIKFSGPRPPVIHVSARRDGAQWLFSVRDEGIGIPAEYLTRVFQVFQRLQPREYAGTGIGLAICERIVVRHGGRIWVESVPDHGSTFFFTLPGVDSR